MTTLTLQDMSTIYLVGALTLGFILWNTVFRVKKRRTASIQGITLTQDELEEHAKNISLKHTVSSNKDRLHWPVTRMNSNFSAIRQAYRDLSAETDAKKSLPPAAEWLLDNYYVIEEQVNALRKDLSKKSYLALPVLQKGPNKGDTRVLTLATELITHTHGVVDRDMLLNYLNAYQTHNILFEQEIYSIPAMLRLALIEHIRGISEEILETKAQWDLADKAYDAWCSTMQGNTESLQSLFKNPDLAINAEITSVNPSYLEHLFYRLRRSGRKYSDVLRYMDRKLDRFGTTIGSVAQKEHHTQTVNTVAMGNCIVSLKTLSSLNWTELFDSVSYLEKILNQDPAETYPLMDIPSRFQYKSTVVKLAKNHGVSELFIAREALNLAQQALLLQSSASAEAKVEERLLHIGYYLVDDGLNQLEALQPQPLSFRSRWTKSLEDRSGSLYMLSIASSTLLLTSLLVIYALMNVTADYLFYGLLTAFAVVLPTSEIVIALANWTVTRLKSPAIFPRLALKDGIPDALSTVVVIPALLPDKKRVDELMENMENHYLGNREKNLYFALIGAFKDSAEETDRDDAGVIQEAADRIKALNAKYTIGEKDIFYFYNRKRTFNSHDKTWTGWERKRGALMEFNELLLGNKSTSFSFSSSSELPDSHLKYVITLDADSVLPFGMAKKMIGTMAHPLNQPFIDPEKGVVTKGYGLIQPKISFDSDSSNRSVFSRIYTGQEGLDPYASAISDVYQDLFSEGIFTGKGIYDLKVFHSVLSGKLPENAILSHDLLEGSFVRVALVSDLELVDSYPSKYNSYMARLHRWIRGDWQLIPWLFPQIRIKNNTRIANPLSKLSKWKMTDNLRRSLLAPFVMGLLALGISILPGSGLVWIALGLASMVLPLLLSLLSQLFSGGLKSDNIKRHLPGFYGLKASLFQFILGIVFLPYQAVTAGDAIIVTLNRVFITKKNMLEWVTSSDADKSQPNSFKSYLTAMGFSALSGLMFMALAYAFKPELLLLTSILALIWISSPFIAYRISRDDPPQKEPLTSRDLQELRIIGRKTWRYFEEFSNHANHDLAPDNFQEEPHRGVAHKTSPTNIGLGLLAILTARDMGYIGLLETKSKIMNTITTIEKLEKWHGHLYNWYDTVTLEPLKPRYISTVDSGNLICYLTTLVQGLEEYEGKPLIDPAYSHGMYDTFCAGLKEHQSAPAEGTPDAVNVGQWRKILENALLESARDDLLAPEWRVKYRQMNQSMETELLLFLPWAGLTGTMPQEELPTAFESKTQDLLALLNMNVSPKDLPNLAKHIFAVCEQLLQELPSSPEGRGEAAIQWVNSVKEAAEKSMRFSRDFLEEYHQLIARISALSMNTRFNPLYNEQRQLFYIGYNLEEMKPTNSYYDLLASEARQTSYLAIARGEIPPKHWSMLGRSLTVVNRFKGLISWSGTMFEYLMPLLIMRSYKNTLLDETYSFVVKSQMKYGKERNVPWGTSESAYNALDISLNYQYKAIGVPWLGLKRGLAEDVVIAPYATLLALMVDPKAAYQNIQILKNEDMEGDYGFYEAADYTPSRLDTDVQKAIIRSYMAHHQGMSLLAINNYLNRNTMQTRFAKDPHIRAARLLLQEKVPLHVVFTKESKEKIISSKSNFAPDKVSVRHFTSPDATLPKTVLLSNENYFVCLTDKGTGYSRTRDMDISRWRDDALMNEYGTFFYFENMETGRLWSSTYAPLNEMPENYEVTFSTDKAAFKRVDGDMETLTEIVVAAGDHAEIRRIRLRNTGESACTVQITSYLELASAPHGTDLAHPAFSKLFLQTEYDPQHRILFAHRRPRSPGEKGVWVGAIPVFQGEIQGQISYETDRAQFLGRGNHPGNPDVIMQKKNLSNTTGAVLDPILSLRAEIHIEPGSTASFYYITAVADSKADLFDLVEKYNRPDACDASFRYALTRSQVEAKYLNIKAVEIQRYEEFISDILFLSPQRRRFGTVIQENRLGQESLWRFGISGDRPIVLLVLDKIDETALLYELLKAHEYWRLKDLRVDLVILSQEESSYENPLYSLITEIVFSTKTQDVLNRHPDVFILSAGTITPEEVQLLYANAKLIFKGSDGSMDDQRYFAPQETEEIPKNRIHGPDASPPLDSLTEGHLQSSEPSQNPDSPVAPLFWNGFGGFGPKGKSYQITLTKNLMTPAPWVNVIANPDFGFLVSETGGGYTWCRNSRENKITPWSNDPVGDEPGEVFYIRDELHSLWTMTPLPIREKEPYRIEHGFGYTTFHHDSHGIAQELTQFVPVKGMHKTSLIQLHNHSGKTKTLTLTYYMTPVLGVSSSVTAMHILSTQKPDGSLQLENRNNREFPDMICTMSSSEKIQSVTGDRSDFLGSGNLRSPSALHGTMLSGKTGAAYVPCGAVQVEFTLADQEVKDLVFILGMEDKSVSSSPSPIPSVRVQEAKSALEEVKLFWQEKLHRVEVDTPESSMNVLLNGWLLYQVISCRLWGRSGFYQSGGAYGFRDQLQDSLALAVIWPEQARSQIIVHARHQFEEGDVLHWWHEPSGKGTRTRISDDYLWLPYVTSEYIVMTGDFNILLEKIPYLSEPPLKDHEVDRYCQPQPTPDEFSLYDHCIRSVNQALQFGSHHLPLIRGGDWNDGMNAVGSGGKGESIWLGWFLCAVLKKMIPLCRRMEDNTNADIFSTALQQLTQSLEEHAWDGQWYIRAFFDDGSPLGSALNQECRIDSLAQTWAVLSDAGDLPRAKLAMQSLGANLVMREERLIKLLTPPFRDGLPDPGYIKGYPPGVRENGGQYTHAAAWVVSAWAKLRDGNRAGECFSMLNPINHAQTFQDMMRYKIEPYVMAADVYSEPPHEGRGGWSWYTGSAGWMFTAGLQNLLGFQKIGDKLVIDPCVPETWTVFSIKYKYETTLYTLTVKNPQGLCHGVSQVSLDGELLQEHVIPLVNDHLPHDVEILMG